MLKGANLRNTEWALGLCTYTGSDTKIMMNSQKSRQKMSNLEGNINQMVIYVILLQVIICSGMAVLGYFWAAEDTKWDDIFL